MYVFIHFCFSLSSCSHHSDCGEDKKQELAHLVYEYAPSCKPISCTNECTCTYVMCMSPQYVYDMNYAIRCTYMYSKAPNFRGT